MVCNLIKISPGHEGEDKLGDMYIKIILLQNIQNILFVLRLKR